MVGLSIWKLLLVLLVIALIFGGRRLPELGKGLGAGIANFRKAVKDEDLTSEVELSSEKETEKPA